jgi:hypothetical protein
MTWPAIPFGVMAVFYAVLVLLVATALLWRRASTAKQRSAGRIQKRLRVSEFGEWNLIADYEPAPQPAKKAAPRAVLTVKLATSIARIGDFRPICSISIENTGSRELERCAVQMEQFSGAAPPTMPMPLTLRSEGQIVSRDKGRFTLAPEQIKRVPVVFNSMTRTNELYFFDENGHAFLYPPGLYRAGQISMVLGVYGGSMPGKVLVQLGTSEHGKIYTKLQIVADDYKLPAGATAQN